MRWSAAGMAIDVSTLLAPGTVVEVSNLFTGRWCGGFRVVAWEADGSGYRIARTSDGSEVPAVFAAVRLRPVAAGV